MEYNDEKILSISDYEVMAKAYAEQLKKRGFMLVQIDSPESKQLCDECIELMMEIKSQLFALGGFLNTSKIYSLNERQIKKLALLYDCTPTPIKSVYISDKTKLFLSFLSNEFALLKTLIELSSKTNFESEISKIINSRLILLSQTLSI